MPRTDRYAVAAMASDLLDGIRRSRPWWIVVVLVLVIGGCDSSGGGASATPGPRVACNGVPQAPCDQAVASLEGSFGAPVVQINVSCNVAVCTPTEGGVSIDVLLADGRRESSGYGYGSAQPQPVQIDPPVLTVAPVCLGLPFAQCKDMAQSAIQGDVGGVAGKRRPPVARITIRCSGVCTPTKGEGQTRIDYVDGTNTTSSWGYESSGG